MKRIILTIGLFLTQLVSNASNEAPLVLEYNGLEETQNLKHLENDTEFCCYFEVVRVKNDTLEKGIIRIFDKKSGVLLGTIWGVPTKEFLMKLYKKELSPTLVDDIVKNIACE